MWRVSMLCLLAACGSGHEELQVRVSGECGPDAAIASIAADGTVTCEDDDVGAAITAGSGIVVSGSEVSVDNDVVARKDTAAGAQDFGDTTLYLDYPSGQVGVGTTTPEAALDVAGEVQADGYRYSSAKTGVYAVTGSTFTASGEPWSISFGAIYTVNGGMVNLAAAVPLPVGAQVTELTCYLYDNHGGAITGGASLRCGWVGGDLVASAFEADGTSGASTTMRAYTDTLTTPYVVDGTGPCFLQGGISAGAGGNLLRFQGCEVTYLYDVVP